MRGNQIAERLKALLEEAHGDEWNVIVKHVEKVKSYAPRVYHLVYDLRCFPASDNSVLPATSTLERTLMRVLPDP